MRHFVLYGTPTGKGRVRVTRTGHAFTPQKTRDYEKAVKLAYLAAVKDEPFPKGTPLKLSLMCLYPIPTSDSKRKRLEKIKGIIKPTVKPDLSNVLKSVEDALNEVCYADDSQITSISVSKWYGEEPGIEVFIEVDEP